jgi:hypothetical protein
MSIRQYNTPLMLTRTLNAYLSSFAGLSRDVWMLGLVSFINRAGAMVFPFLAVYLTLELGFSKPHAALVLTSFVSLRATPS